MVYYMDRVFHIGGFRFGLDGVVGLIPGLGDAMGAIAGTVILYRAARAGVPKSALLRMAANIGIDAAIGAIPLIGDVFDFVFKASTINARIYRDSLEGRHRTSSDWVFLGGLAVVITLIVIVPFLVLAWLLSAIFG